MQKLNQDINIGKNIRTLRKQSKLTQEQITTKLQLCGFDISRGTYAKIEAGIQNISVSMILCFCDIFDVNVSDIVKK